ncbi:hypothetical protein I3760_03G115100 [Carya illinoinensis]|uniref:NAC domain-containing protein n=1 Tax=Carya illinoinensis TaxID=32201 RepID=A0A8T1R3K6_CARIL|nr:NAC domain-containing protein 82-like [Carya illinoinensis]KAG2716248.1 hypothetical protein I3760_03G115100 [Carya illinoinensis]KAG2716249.1 hypothetical protein I3760_03G115100 [Carya illinoinensis]KAG6660691.1 hypothetical protein CIPAW_03G122600 [Carya illinoinensis]KAG6721570.1 hypothetical protein I3842_03G118000 [Carya illinoinensis]KAG6721571.1 hypothetical protein I3842_03G118000 [Carya illinoinensis]
MGKALRLPPGYRFCPTDDELVVLYLKRKIKGERFYPEPVAEADIYKFAPWELPGKFKSESGDLRLYFLCPVEKKYAKGQRINRETKDGCWKKTGKDSSVHHHKELVGSKKTLVFHKNLNLTATGLRGGKAPQRERTDWVMHEYSLGDQYMAKEGIVKNTYVLCRIFQKEGLGPRNGAQYGAPFKEEEWNYDEEDDSAETVTLAGLLPNSSSNLAAIGTNVLGVTTSESGLSEAIQSQREGISAVLNNDASNELSQVLGNNKPIKKKVLGNNEILPKVPTSFQEDNPSILSEDNRNRDLNHQEDALSISDIMDSFEDFYYCEGDDFPLGDLFLGMADLERPLDAHPT